MDNIPLNEYPRPSFKRDSYILLNSEWNFSILKTKDLQENLEEKILVPYCVESILSGVKKHVEKDDLLHYKKTIKIPSSFNKGKVLINFGAVDQEMELYVNKKYVGNHFGGYLPFTFDITKFLTFKDEEEIYVIVKDDTDSDIYAKGKQTNKPGGIYYTPISGIWQSVFLESVPENYVKKINMDCDYDNGNISFELETEGEINNLQVEIIFNEKVIGTIKPEGNNFNYHFDTFKSWSPEEPNLYDVRIKYQNDEIKTYFGMRKFSIEKNSKGFKTFMLNNKPIFLKGVLDQGYFMQGIYTPESYAELKNDIQIMKDMGFNMLRKHIKVEFPLFYYYCDKMGMLVWQDLVNGGGKFTPWYVVVRPNIGLKYNDTNYKKLGRSNPESRKRFEIEAKETIEYLKNTTSICGWTIFNEGWGQFDSVRITENVKALDSSRFIDSCSGWYDQGVGDCYSKHIYFRKLKMKNDLKRVAFLSEFGGYSWYIKENAFSSKEFGYKKFKDRSSLEDGIESLFLKELAPLIEICGLSGYVYTQVSDVEQEVNGFITYDRKVVKVDVLKMHSINKKLDDEFNKIN